MGLLLLLGASFIGMIFCLLEIVIDEEKTFIIPLLVCVGLFVFSCFCEYKIEHAFEEHITISTEDIVALNDNNLVNGRGYYRSCRIDENLYYQYIVDLHDGSYVANKVNASTTYIKETDGQPRVEWREKTQKYLCFHYSEPYNVIYVPEGCITYDFTIDLE